MESDQNLFGEYSKLENAGGVELSDSFSSKNNHQTHFFSLPELSMLEKIMEEDQFLQSENVFRRFSDTDFMLNNEIYCDENVFIDFFERNNDRTYMSLENFQPSPDRLANFNLNFPLLYHSYYSDSSHPFILIFYFKNDVTNFKNKIKFFIYIKNSCPLIF
uniref:Uncharacterized protein n=1 Tax=Strongyloides stercoralis TaxID=6248 RepID=A0AAF5CZ26_STRER